MSQGSPNIARVVRQHAETARLLGVDFVPVYRERDVRGSAAHAITSPSPQNAPQEAQPLAQATTSPVEKPHSEPVLKRTQMAAHTPKSTDSTSPAPAPELKIGRTSSAKPVVVEVPAQPPPPAARPAVVHTPGAGKNAEERQAQLDALRARYEADAPHKQFVTSFTNIVFGEGDPCARLMFVGEAPGEEEDKTGRPFVGRAGQLLDKMIVAMGLQRSSVYIANVLKTRPPNNATPTLEESRLCAPYLYEQIAIVDPEVIVTLGLPATRTLLGTMEAMGKLRGRWASFNPGGLAGGKTFHVMPTYHPAYLLRNYTPQERAKVWSDLQLVMDRLGLAKQSAGPG